MTNLVRIRGVDYPSQKAAAEALGVVPMTITRALDLGTIDRVGLRQTKIPVTIRGVDYPSMAAAARALGVRLRTIENARRRDTLNNVGLSKAAAATRPSSPVTIRGVTYASVAAAAAEFNMYPLSITTAIARGTLDQVGVAREILNAKPMTVFGRSFVSRSACARFYGVCAPSLRLAIRQNRVESFLRDNATENIDRDVMSR